LRRKTVRAKDLRVPDEEELEKIERRRKPTHGHVRFGGKIEATYTTFEDGTIRFIFSPPVMVQPSKWHKRKLDVLEASPK
jgi:hypothetical protein